MMVDHFFYQNIGIILELLKIIKGFSFFHFVKNNKKKHRIFFNSFNNIFFIFFYGKSNKCYFLVCIAK